MLKTFLLLVLCVGIFATGECGGLTTFFHRKTTTEQPQEVSTTTTTSTVQLPSNYFIVNNIPKVEKGCQIRYTCKKALKRAESPKPCVKFCVKKIDCDDGTSTKGTPEQCLVLNEELVATEYNDCKKDVDSPVMQNNEIEGTTIVPIKEVAMIDFPCQPGYLPDSRGRCREVW